VKDQLNRVMLRPVKEDELETLWSLIYQDGSPEWKKWDAPYFPLKNLTFDEFLKHKGRYVESEDYMAIEVDGKIIGTVVYYWEHEPSRWLEMGITIYHSDYWNGGYGTEALSKWMTHLFQTKELARVGYTTWSGNKRMVKVGEKLGMTMEACLRKCRYYNGEYYDSIRMGILREEWEQQIS